MDGGVDGNRIVLSVNLSNNQHFTLIGKSRGSPTKVRNIVLEVLTNAVGRGNKERHDY